jgi:hypothetical protein
MSNDSSTPRAATGTTDIITLEQFEEQVRHAARFDAGAPTENPLAAAVQKIRDNPALMPSRLLGRMLHALTYHAGEFRRADVSALDPAALRIMIALMNAARSNTNSRGDWISAVNDADAATA